MKIGFIGLGQMGIGMAENLIKADHEVTVYNRTPERAAPLADKGATIAADLRAACEADAVFTMLANDEAVRGLVLGTDGVLAHLSPGAVHISSSTISVALSGELEAAHEGAGQAYVAAPVFGRPEAAAAGKLFVVAAGAAPALERVQPLMDAIGQKTFIVSDSPKAANLVKLSGNFLIATVIESLGEAMALAGKGGVDRHMLLEILTSTIFGAPVYKTYGGLLADRKFEPAGFAAPLGHKDIALVLAAANDLRVPLPFGSVLRDRLLTLLATGGETLDWSALGSLAARDAGLD